MPEAITPELKQILDGTPIAHLATVLPDGGPHATPVWIGTHDGYAVIMTGPTSRKARNLHEDPRVAVSLTSPDNVFEPVTLRGRVVEWRDGDRGWELVDGLAQKYIGAAYGREQERVAGLIAVDHHQIGM